MRERKELRLRILDSAQTLFEQGGEDAVTLRAVAHSIEYSATTIYAHFPNKAALLDALCEAQLARFAQSIQRAERHPEPVERLKNVAREYVDFGLQNPEHYRLLMRRQAASTDASKDGTGPLAERQISGAAGGAKEVPVTHSLGDSLQRTVFKAMAAGCFRPEYRDVPLLAQILWSCLHGLVTLHAVRSQHPGVVWKPVHSTVEGCLETLLNGMLSPAHQLPATWQK